MFAIQGQQRATILHSKAEIGRARTGTEAGKDLPAQRPKTDELVPAERRARAFGIFYTCTIGAGAVSPSIYGLLSDIAGLPVALVVDRNWEEGAAAPIRAGVLALAGSCSGALLLHAAQSGVTSADLQRLVDLWRRNPRAIVAAQCGGGHELPAIFPRSEFPALLRLSGSQGARILLRSPNATLTGVPMPSALVGVP